MKIVVVGTRGIPDIQGGVETHCENLYPLIISEEYNIILLRRSCYVSSANKMHEYKGIKIKDVYAPKIKSIEAIIHTFLSVCYARRQRADILHVHAIGPSLLVPFAKFLGMKVVMTHHGADYDRQKWGKMAKYMLRKGERYAARYANQIIAISEVIINDLKIKYKRENNVNLIFNGVNLPKRIETTAYLQSIGLTSRKYIFTLGRFVEEKGFHNLIEAYLNCAYKEDFKLVIAGDADHETNYSLKLKKLASNNNVVLTGFLKGDNLSELFSHAALFVLPSFHEGLPISLLEAMSYQLDVLVSDIPANKAVITSNDISFDPSDVKQLTLLLNRKLMNPSYFVYYDLSKYDWRNIAIQTQKVYDSLCQ